MDNNTIIQTYTKADEAIEIVDKIHDCRFELDEIKYDQYKKILSIQFEMEIYDNATIEKKFLFFKKIITPVNKCFLKINHVKQYEIRDNAQIGRYDFNEVKIDEFRGTVLITSGFPLEIEIDVEKVNIDLEITDEVVDKKISIGI